MPGMRPYNRRDLAFLWIGVSCAIGLILAAVVLLRAGVSPHSVTNALRITARWAFMPFWLAYTSRALAVIGSSRLASISRHGREFGLAYAAAMGVHVGLIIWLFQISTHAPLTGVLLLFFAVGIAWTYLLAALSFGSLIARIGPRAWKTIRVLGMNYILLAFAYDFLPALTHPVAPHYRMQRLMEYLPFDLLTIAAPLVLIAAACYKRLARWRTPAVEARELHAAAR